MPPYIYVVRHAEGEHNVNDASWVRDAPLTELGKQQSRDLRDRFDKHDLISLVISSPLTRAIQTTIIAFAPTIARPDVEYLLMPMAQEVSAKTCDVGFASTELKKRIEGYCDGEDVGPSLAKINYDAVEEGWNSKVGYWAADRPAVQTRAADLRTWLYARPEPHILLITHGAFLHYLTEDWSGDDPKRGTAYLNCEVRQFGFTPGSDKNEAHFRETDESRKSRGAMSGEEDATVLEQLEDIETC